jgi:16S rRNA (guanine1516-N2)-methyltransferase
MMKLCVTVSLDASDEIRQRARREADELGLPFYERKETLEATGQNGEDAFLVYTRRLPELHAAGGVYRFHVGTAKLRILQLKRSGGDRLMNLLPSHRPLRILDTTFGTGGDSLLFSWFLGAQGTVTALEKSPALYVIGAWGIAHFDPKEEEMKEALRRIHLVHADLFTFLKNQPDNSFDVVYMDPMFRHPVKRKENHTEAFREAACGDRLSEDVLREASRVAAYQVIVKERPFSCLFRTGLFSRVETKKGQSTAYGVIE